ncbi:hypothetical protein [Limnohabitans sp. B9-3]|uniref:hypothetical protein n=1 Tax=Limnohabitans sp. B9-3 TaxID=1100707 RepID=UPI00117BBF2B|nr:hypothetical protein [Limnohabitans sp. B9-3]
MTPSPRFFLPRLLVVLFMSAVGWLTPVWASEPKKTVVVEEEGKKFKYANEAGEAGRSGYVYKRALKTIDGEPQPKIWEPAPEPVVAPKEAQAKGDGHGKPDAHGDKKVEKKDDTKGDPKKEEKKKEDKKGGDAHGGGHGKAKAPEPITSAVYDANVIKLDATHRPFTKAVQSNAYADYFLCRKTISDKYRDTVLDEINTFADRMDLPRAQDTPCMVKVAKASTKFPGAIYIEFYVDESAAKACIKNGECGSTRVMMLYPKDKTGKKSQEVYRSYVLTDERKYRRASFCVSPQGQLLGEKSCYVAVNPDWLFN